MFHGRGSRCLGALGVGGSEVPLGFALQKA